MFSCEFCEISRSNFFYRTHIGATVFGLSFINPRTKSVKELVSLNPDSGVIFYIKSRKDLLKRKDQEQPPEFFLVKKEHLSQSLFLNKVSGHRFFAVNFAKF